MKYSPVGRDPLLLARARRTGGFSLGEFSHRHMSTRSRVFGSSHGILLLLVCCSLGTGSPNKSWRQGKLLPLAKSLLANSHKPSGGQEATSFHANGCTTDEVSVKYSPVGRDPLLSARARWMDGFSVGEFGHQHEYRVPFLRRQPWNPTCSLNCPRPPLEGYSQWQSQTAARREGKCHAPANNQFCIHDNSPGDMHPEGQTAEYSKSYQHNTPDYENIILRT